MLNKKQKYVALEIPKNTIVSASPGTGKTKTLVARAIHKLSSIPPHKSLALITYTNAAADEIASRIISYKDEIFIGTIHRFCLAFILRPFGWIYKWSKPKIITYAELLEFLENNQDINLGNSPIDELNKIKKLVSGELDKSVDWYNESSLEYVAELYYNFLESKESIDFNEILYRSYKLISENDFIVNSLANKFYEILIDEFQDTNIFQYEIFKNINKKGLSTFFIVGDEKQRIYRFAGAIDNAFNKASLDFSAPIKELDITYRSTNNIIEAFSKLFQNHPKLVNESKYKNTDLKITIHETDNDSNIQYIDYCIDYLIKSKIKLSDIAVLTTSWFEAINISRALRQKYNIVGLGALPHRHINNSTFSLIRSTSRYLHSASIKNLRSIRRNVELHALENNLNLSANELNHASNYLITKLSSIDKGLPIFEGLAIIKDLFKSVFRIDHSTLDEIINLIDDEEANYWTIGKYFETLSGTGGVTINTIHQAKGLEYEAVILNGINTGRIPFQSWDPVSRTRGPLTPENLENGRTLLYVGISRAKLLLVILHNWNPSLFIKIIRP
jgi:DNA helicase II / ATP-dependent DNA helicase PcrA